MATGVQHQITIGAAKAPTLAGDVAAGQDGGVSIRCSNVAPVVVDVALHLGKELATLDDTSSVDESYALTVQGNPLAGSKAPAAVVDSASSIDDQVAVGADGTGVRQLAREVELQVVGVDGVGLGTQGGPVGERNSGVAGQ